MGVSSISNGHHDHKTRAVAAGQRVGNFLLYLPSKHGRHNVPITGASPAHLTIGCEQGAALTPLQDPLLPTQNLQRRPEQRGSRMMQCLWLPL